jgi:hypothetical protein
MSADSIQVAERNIAKLERALHDAQRVLQTVEQAQEVAQRAHEWSGRRAGRLRKTIFIGIGAIAVAVVVIVVRRQVVGTGQPAIQAVPSDQDAVLSRSEER